MKVEELMVYDWVRIKKDIYDSNENIIPKGTYIQVTEILDNWINFHTSGPYVPNLISIDDIEPIQLTSDILINARFEHKEFFAQLKFEKFTIRCDCLSVEIREEVGENEYKTKLSVDCKYVHQLQNILRVCGFPEVSDDFIEIF